MQILQLTSVHNHAYVCVYISNVFVIYKGTSIHTVLDCFEVVKAVLFQAC